MDTETLLLVLIIVILVGYMIFPLFCNGSSHEGFDQMTVKVGNPAINAEIDNSPFVGLPSSVIPAWGYDTKYGDFEEVNDGRQENDAGLGFNLCSKSCCSSQYPLPFEVPVDPLVCSSKQKFVSSSYTCNNGWQNSGCLCMTQNQSEQLESRGGNA